MHLELTSVVKDASLFRLLSFVHERAVIRSGTARLPWSIPKANGERMLHPLCFSANGPNEIRLLLKSGNPFSFTRALLRVSSRVKDEKWCQTPFKSPKRKYFPLSNSATVTFQENVRIVHTSWGRPPETIFKCLRRKFDFLWNCFALMQNSWRMFKGSTCPSSTWI